MKLELKTRIRQNLGVSSEINALHKSRNSEVRRPELYGTLIQGRRNWESLDEF
jgi:hypothetical protein